MRQRGGVDAEEAEEEGRCEGRGREMAKGRHTGRSDNKDNIPPPPPHPPHPRELTAAVA